MRNSLATMIAYASFSAAQAQPAVQPQNIQPTANIPQIMPSPQSILRTGTPVSLRLMESITTKEKAARINDRVRMEVAEAVKVGDTIVIPVGSPAVGELVDVRYKGMWGRSGRIVGRVLTVDANGRTVRMSGTFDTNGGSGTAAAVVTSAIVFLPAGFFMTGKSAAFTAGSIVRGFIDEDIPLTFVPRVVSTTQPMAVSAPAAPAAPAASVASPAPSAITAPK